MTAHESDSSLPSAPVSRLVLPTFTDIFDALARQYGLRARASQLKLAAYVRDALQPHKVCCIEAPTGTGKTFGYLAGAIDAQVHSGNPQPIVVATATVGLQEQILRKDIPMLVAIGAVAASQVAVAKGRGRYFCPRTAALLDDKKMRDSQTDMFNTEKHVAEKGTPIALDMLKAWRNKEWDGDRDSWPGSLPECWDSACGASSDTCVNRACEHYDSCPYMASRARLSRASLIIANHDIVLADLAQRADEQSTTVLPLKSYALIVDEAHNLPDKAVATKASRVKLLGNDWLHQLEGYGDVVWATPQLAKALDRAGVSATVFHGTASSLQRDMEAMNTELLSALPFVSSGLSSWGLKVPDDALQGRLVALAGHAVSILQALKVAAKSYAEMAEEASGREKGDAVRALANTHKFHRQAAELQEGLEMFCSSETMVRWAQRSKDGTSVSLHVEPVEGKGVLDELLWSTDFPVALVSATLQIGGSFKRFSDKSGLPGRAVTAALPPVFDYSRGYLHQPKMDNAPSDPDFESEVVNKLDRLFKQSGAPGTLVLFTSRESMKRVARDLTLTYGEMLFVQDSRPLPELVDQHKARIDAGERSILMGLNSMAEGLDLPGGYCSHVIITRLPFSVPGDPVEEARQELLGDAWFEEAYLADMLIMLIQATGRLIRREDDHGIVTLLDNRLATKRYGKKVIAALPNFSRGETLKGYRTLAADRLFDMSHGRHKAKTATKPQEPPMKKSGLALVHSSAEPREKAPASVSRPKVHASGLDMCLGSLRKLTEQPFVRGRPVIASEATLHGALADIMPAELGPFPEDEPGYLVDDMEHPCLPLNTPAYVWANRQLPQAVMLGLRLVNGHWPDGIDDRKPWLKVLSLRPDLLQAVEILRSHTLGLADPRKSAVPAWMCTQALAQALGGLGAPSEEALIEALHDFERDTLNVIQAHHALPTKELMLDMCDAAQKLGRCLRSEAMVA